MAALSSKPLPRRLLIALLASLLVHLWVTGDIDFSTAPEPITPPPIEARLSGSAFAPHKSAPARQPVRPHTSQPGVPKRDELLPAPEAELALPVAASAGNASAQGTAIAAEPTTPSAAAALPEAFKIRFRVQGNEGGLLLGQLEHIWQRTGERYSLVGVAKASGVFALFYSGLLSQTSSGVIAPEGLRPESYWMQRSRKSYSANFDWERKSTRLGGPYGALALAPGTQDYLSVVYQLALFRHPAEGRVWVIDGKRAKEYAYREIGPETIELPLGKVATLHLRIGQGNEEADMDLWLRAQAPHLPLKMTLIDDKGRSGVLLAETVE